MDHIVSSSHLLHRLRVDFGEPGGRSRFARLLGVTPTTAAAMLRGAADVSLIKAAAHYGFEPADLKDEWRKSDTKLDPKKAGRRNWSEDEVQELCQQIAKARTTAQVARAMGVTPGAIQIALRRRGISIRTLRAGA